MPCKYGYSEIQLEPGGTHVLSTWCTCFVRASHLAFELPKASCDAYREGAAAG
jgi:hypothetical protein